MFYSLNIFVLLLGHWMTELVETQNSLWSR